MAPAHTQLNHQRNPPNNPGSEPNATHPRCLVKNLESLRIHYDGTVRDNCDASVVQLAYGEDGLDVMNVSYIRQFEFLARNAERLAQQVDKEAALAAG